jgi:ADP-heptose:LPS heptosyltransferase
MGLRSEDPPPLVWAGDPDAREWVEGRVTETPYVVIHPGGPWETKRWAADRFRELGRRLGRNGWKTVFTAGPGEGNIAQEAARDVENSLILLGLDLPRLGELVRGAAAFVGNDSGPMHLASAVGTPVVAVWGSSDSARWRPWKVPCRVVQNPFDCNPCDGYRCHVQSTPACIESVTVDQVEAAFDALTREAGKSGTPTPEIAHIEGSRR